MIVLSNRAWKRVAAVLIVLLASSIVFSATV